MKAARSQAPNSLLSKWGGIEYIYKGKLWWVQHTAVCSREDSQPLLLGICFLFLFSVLLFLDTFNTFIYCRSLIRTSNKTRTSDLQWYTIAHTAMVSIYFVIIQRANMFLGKIIDTNRSIYWSVFIYGSCLDIKIVWAIEAKEIKYQWPNSSKSRSNMAQTSIQLLCIFIVLIDKKFCHFIFNLKTTTV